ncbi:dTDP-4-amino-4,6-dideoxyglucose formyltransferase [Shewanella sp. TB4-MNA-CIBAN-0142]|uniref:dTDP-4-amino-4,6-dideoxyglucose formyltransferase n=1 Tax=Shewanella sp. TB4-MNA-CIBAN-0142 TaxID=3140464 RepID=UPI0033297ACD
MKVLVLTDNIYIFKRFKEIVNSKDRNEIFFTYCCSPSSRDIFSLEDDVSVLDIKLEYESVIDEYDLVISCHCKKIFPKKLVTKLRCINIHPGLNPYNRGWYPQVFAINNKKPHGATIHVMDEAIDHGDIIVQSKVNILSYDTSLSVYEKVVESEIELFDKEFDSIIDNSYIASPMEDEGNYNGISDFKNLCKLDLSNVGTLGEHIDLLRSLTHGTYKNGYFIDSEGEKILISISLIKEG